MFTDLTEQENRITVAVRNDQIRGEVQRRLAQLGIPGGAVIFTQADSVVLDVGRSAAPPQTCTAFPPKTTDCHRPLKGGIRQTSAKSNGTIGVCTVGFITDFGGAPAYITNSHCTSTYWGPDASQNFFQPTWNDPYWVGREYRDPPGESCGYLSPNTCRYSDAAAVVLNTGIGATRGAIAHPRWFNPAPADAATIEPVDPEFEIIGEAVPGPTDYVDKVGITTGWTGGGITYTCIDTPADANRRRMRCQDLASYTSDEGDSGAPVFLWRSSGQVTLLGIHWGRIYHEGGYHAGFSAIANIRNDMNGLGPIYR